ncbi:MAG TPA: transcriptional regulator [Thermoplasmataceae archaeon]|nr:transcriptional regulator [Thermoplasmataceae archaeon]
MDDYKARTLRSLMEFLNREGFSTLGLEPQTYSSFDLVARRDRLKFIIKILQNIDTLRLVNAAELLRIGRLTSSAPVIVGEKSGSGQLERGIVYYRHQVPILSYDSFVDYVNGEPPFISSGPGGYYVAINGNRLRDVRERAGYSIGYLSKKIGISRRSVSLYENGSQVSVEVFAKLEEILNEDLAKYVDLMEICLRSNLDEGNENFSGFFREVLEAMVARGFDFQGVRKSPFDAIAKDMIDDFLLVSLMETLEERARNVISMMRVGKIFEKDSFVITRANTTKENVGGCPVVTISEIRNSQDAEQISRLIEKRKNA